MRDSFEEFKTLTQSPTPLDKRAQRTQFNKIIRLTLTGSEVGDGLYITSTFLNDMLTYSSEWA
jgi:hypothetical protein